MHTSDRTKVQNRLNNLGHPALPAQKAQKYAGEVREEIAVLKYALSLLQPLSQQLTTARARVLTAEENLNDAGARA